MQYRETDFNFVSRLMEQEGIYYYFEHTAEGHTMVLVDSVDSHEPCAGPYSSIPFVLQSGSSGALDTEYVNHWQLTNSLQPGKTTIRDYDFKKSKQLLEGTLSNAIVAPDGNTGDLRLPR